MSIGQEQRLTIDGLKAYKKQNPEKFKAKFGDLDLENLPENFNIEEHKRKILNAKPKTPVLPQYRNKNDVIDEEEDEEEIEEEVEVIETPEATHTREEMVAELGEDAVKEIEQNAIPAQEVNSNNQ